MNQTENAYAQYALVREMTETPGIIRKFDAGQAVRAAEAMKERGRVFFTGEGSSRLFPAKHFIYQLLRSGLPLQAATDGARQAAEYDLSSFAVFGASNSGKTREVVSLFRTLRERGHEALFSLSAFAGTPLGQAASEGYVLSCGAEDAVAATKSVVEQALFYDALLERLGAKRELASRLGALADAAEEALSLPVDPLLTKKVAEAPVIHWAGRNCGVAEELALKTNEIARKRSAYLEGTYAVHGIEEVMEPEDVVIVIDPFAEEEEKFHEVLVKGVGCTVIAIAARPTAFPTLRIPEVAGLEGYVELLAGWNLLVETAGELGINMDKPQRARKIGNELKG